MLLDISNHMSHIYLIQSISLFYRKPEGHNSDQKQLVTLKQIGDVLGRLKEVANRLENFYSGQPLHWNSCSFVNNNKFSL
uniref:Uncharacterized protein n=1 Tax=Meloidogyne incognita TaxID=6306 RepID=A0A914M1V4_MELIC